MAGCWNERNFTEDTPRELFHLLKSRWLRLLSRSLGWFSHRFFLLPRLSFGLLAASRPTRQHIAANKGRVGKTFTNDAAHCINESCDILGPAVTDRNTCSSR